MKIFHNYEERKARTPRAHFVRLRTLAASEKIRENTRCGGRGGGRERLIGMGKVSECPGDQVGNK